MNGLNASGIQRRQGSNSITVKKLTRKEIEFNCIVSAWNTRDTQGWHYCKGNSNPYQNTKAMTTRIANAAKRSN